MSRPVVLCLLTLALGLAARGAVLHVSSPHKNTEVTITLSDADGSLSYGVTFQGQPVLVDSGLALELREGGALASKLALVTSTEREIQEEWKPVYGRRSQVRNHANELTVTLKETGAPGREVQWVFRAYDDGIAFRYAFPKQEALSRFTLVGEKSEFRFQADHPVWAADFGGFHASQEAHFQERKLNELSPFTPYGCPLLVKVGDAIWALVTEANITDWAGMHLSHSATRANTLVTNLSPREDDLGVLVKDSTVRQSPWRTVILGDNAGRMLESDLVRNLNAPSAITDTSWIKPGKAAWDRWWCGAYMPDVSFPIGMNQDTMKYFVDFAGEMGWNYQIVDWHWYGEPFHPVKGMLAAHPDADITKPVPAINIPELVAYGKSKGVRIILWLEWTQANKQMDEAFALYEKWGVAGVKIDFMDRDDQEVVNFYHRCVKKAAEHKLLVDFHGAFKPDGWSRTYPNLITREGILGNEYNKWSDKVTPDHCLTIPFTRGALGEMDFTPGGWRQKNKEGFRAVGGDAPGPFVMGTRCFQMAMLVVYESAFQVLCDSPYNYRASPAGLDFLKIVPTTWDDTRVLEAQVGDSIAVARRSGDSWFIGAMTDWTARTINLPLNFLGSGEFEVEIWRDAYEAGEYPDRLMKEKRTVSAKDNLSAAMASGGGYIAVLRPKVSGR